MPFWEIRGRAEGRVLPAFLLLYQEGQKAAVTADSWKDRDVSFHHVDNQHVSFLLEDNQHRWRAEPCPSLLTVYTISTETCWELSTLSTWLKGLAIFQRTAWKFL